MRPKKPETPRPLSTSRGREGDAANVVLSAVGHNLCLVLAWLKPLLGLILLALCRAFALAPPFRWAS